ncbi:MAG: pentapeptide repeat-containing protein [Micropepsaceae bacterium]
MTPSKSLSLVLLVAAIAAATVALAANPKDLARVRKGDNFSECIRCDLSGADFEDRFFQLAILNEANLSGSNFDGANLAGTQLNNANLSKGTFRWTNFSGAQMQGADLRGSNFKGSWFNWAWFAGTKLDGADFTNAHFVGAQLQGADLSKAKGLTSSQLRSACADASTRLPPGIERPWCPY